MVATKSAAGLRHRGAAEESYDGGEYEPVETDDQSFEEDDKYRKFKSAKQRESERKAKVVMYITLVMWILMIIFMFYKIGEGLYMAYLHKHGILHTYNA